MRLSEILAIAGALSVTAAGAIEATHEATPRYCVVREACAPLPITLGDEPGRDGPRGPVGPSGATAGSTVTGATGAVGPAYRT